MGMQQFTTVVQADMAVLLAPDPKAKVKTARLAARLWRQGRLEHRFEEMPLRPARPERPDLLPASRMPKRGRGGSERGRIAMLHALAHIEYGAIDLAFDLAGRFGADFPADFIDDWFGVGADEAIHFALLDRRLRTLGSFYGALRMTDCGRRRRRPRATCSPGSRSCRWCWRRAGWT